MRKLILFLIIFISICSFVWAEEGSSIHDYFPFKLYAGYYYNYLEPPNERHNYIECVEVGKDGGEILGVFEETKYLGGAKIKNILIYAIGGNQVFLAYTKTMFFGETVYSIRPIILKMPRENQKVEWHEKASDDEKYIYTAEFSSVIANNAKFNDCIKVTQKTYVKKEFGQRDGLTGLFPDPDDPTFWLVTTYVYYYAKNIGLVRQECYNEKGELRVEFSKALIKIE